MATVDVFGRSMNKAGPRGPAGPKGENGAIVDPTSSYETYVKYINLRRKTIHSILGFVNITSNLHVYHGLIQSLLECNTTQHYFYWTDQAFKDKYIAFEFEKPVWLKQIEFVLNGHSAWTLHFTWQYSDDNGVTWEQIGNEYNKEFTSSFKSPFDSPLELFTFPQKNTKIKK